jgi:hypothetical protein
MSQAMTKGLGFDGPVEVEVPQICISFLYNLASCFLGLSDRSKRRMRTMHCLLQSAAWAISDVVSELLWII